MTWDFWMTDARTGAPLCGYQTMHNMQIRKRGSRVAVGLLLFFVGMGPVWADEAPAPGERGYRATAPTTAPTTAPPAATIAAPQPDKDGFVPESRPMNGPTVDESIPAGPLLATAYGFVWLAVLGYVVFCARGIRRVETELGELSDKLGKLGAKS